MRMFSDGDPNLSRPPPNHGRKFRALSPWMAPCNGILLRAKDCHQAPPADPQNNPNVYREDMRHVYHSEHYAALNLLLERLAARPHFRGFAPAHSARCLLVRSFERDSHLAIPTRSVLDPLCERGTRSGRLLCAPIRHYLSLGTIIASARGSGTRELVRSKSRRLRPQRSAVTSRPANSTAKNVGTPLRLLLT